MEDAMTLLFLFGVPLFLLFLGLVVGTSVERRHFRSLERREQACTDVLVTQLRSFPAASAEPHTPTMVIAEVVIATDYLKTFLAAIRKIFGGEVRSYESILVRARREALLRLIEQAREAGFNALCNVRLNTADIGGSNVASGNQGRKMSVMGTILASATAYRADFAKLPTGTTLGPGRFGWVRESASKP